VRYILHDLTIDSEARSVRRGTDAIKLPDLSFDALITLIEATPEPVSHSALSQSVWGAQYVSDETVSQRIALLRKALADNPKDPTYIRTVRGTGYAIIGPVKRLVADPTNDHSEPSEGKRSFGLIGGLVAGGLMVSLLVAIFAFQAQSSVSPDAQAAGQTSATSEVSLLVSRANAQLGLHQSAETDRAVAMLRDALRREPDDFDARLSLSFALSTKATKFGGNLDTKKEAEGLARALIDEQPDNSNAWSALGYSLGSQGRMDESLSALQYAYQLNPDNAPAGSSAAHVLLVQGQLYQALDLEFQVLEAGGRSRYAEIQIAQNLELIGHPAAERWRAKALTLNPGQVVVLSAVARSQLRDGQAQAALETLSLAKGDDATAPPILQMRGRANLALGRIADAKRDMMSAGWRGLYDLAALDAKAGKTDRADALVTPAKLAELDGDPDPEFRIQLAEVFASMDRVDEAAALITQAVNLGWRDVKWLERSPFLEGLVNSSEWQQIEDRITREVRTQRRLTEGDARLANAINS